MPRGEERNLPGEIERQNEMQQHNETEDINRKEIRKSGGKELYTCILQGS